MLLTCMSGSVCNVLIHKKKGVDVFATMLTIVCYFQQELGSYVSLIEFCVIRSVYFLVVEQTM